MMISDPTPSPDGRVIAFVVANYMDNTGDIWLVNRDGTGLRNLTGDGPLDDAPAWSPDGTRLAYRSFREENFGDIWTIRADGTERTILTPKSGTVVLDHHRPDWSPDGSRIVYAGTGGGDWGIWVMRADGSQKRQLTSTPELDTEPVWSPDGKTIAFRRTGNTGSDLVLMAPDGSEVRVIALPGQQRLPAWSPDGRLIAFVGQPTVSSLPEVYTMRPDATDIRAQVGVAGFGPALHPDFLRR
jgi:Tol biopolymer transport system component